MKRLLLLLPACTATTGPLSALERDHTVQEGAFRPFYVEDCAQLASCYASNATSPYGLWYLPPEPDTAPLEVTEGQLPPDEQGRTAAWRLRPDEAAVFIGPTPPPARYFSFTPYLYSRADDGERYPVFASLTDALNLTALGDDPFQRDIAVIVTASSQLERDIREALPLPDGDIHTLALDADLLRMGSAETDDLEMVLQRFALFDDADAGRAYLDGGSMQVFRVTPDEASAIAPLTPAARTPRASGQPENALEDALDALDAALRARYADATVTDVTVLDAQLVTTFLQPDSCIANLRDCLGEVSDTVYSTGPRPPQLGAGETVTLGPGERVVAFGVNHTATGRATYSNVVVMNQERLAGVASFTSDAMPGSAAALLPDHPDADSLFAVSFMRDCGDEPACVEVPEGFPGADLDEPVSFVFRAYLQPGASVSADPAELVPERLLHVAP